MEAARETLNKILQAMRPGKHLGIGLWYSATGRLAGARWWGASWSTGLVASFMSTPMCPTTAKRTRR
jgi:hypothetical protein